MWTRCGGASPCALPERESARRASVVGKARRCQRCPAASTRAYRLPYPGGLRYPEHPCVILSETKDLTRRATRSFVSLRMTLLFRYDDHSTFATILTRELRLAPIEQSAHPPQHICNELHCHVQPISCFLCSTRHLIPQSVFRASTKSIGQKNGRVTIRIIRGP